MSIKRATPGSNISNYTEKRLRRVAIKMFAYIGERLIKEARRNHRYRRITGNLTSSIGYAVLDNGRIVIKSSFDVVIGGTEGTKEGKAYLRKVAKEHSSGIVLIAVAGMKYAAYVEAKGLNVLESAEMLAEKLFKEFCKVLKLR